MSSDHVIVVEGLGKCYHIYDKPQDRLKQSFFWGRRQFFKEFWALRNVSFEVRRGETLGIIGRNGSGKSTLLQLISGTLAPTEGQLTIDGRIGALLELGAGFNPEFTGRENVYMNAAILGLPPTLVDERYPAIAAFADIGEFIDQPVKTYSTGMFVRLAFAVAIQLNPDILVVDEALSVGDMLFQLKCFLKFQELQEAGTTILFVSHDVNTIKKYCTRTILLEGGRLHFAGPPNDAVNRYTELLFPGGREISAVRIAPTSVLTPDATAASGATQEYRYGSGDGEIVSITLSDATGRSTPVFTAGDKATLSFRAVAGRPIDAPILAMTIKDIKGQDVYVTNTYFQGIEVPPLDVDDEVVVSFEQRLHLAAGTYFVSLGFVSIEGGKVIPMDRRYDVVEIKILNRPGDFSGGIADLQSVIQVRRLGPHKAPIQGAESPASTK